MHRNQRTKTARGGAISVFSYNSELEKGNIPVACEDVLGKRDDDLNPTIAFLQTSDEAKLLAKRLSFATAKFKSLHESSLGTSNPSVYLNREIEDCSAECIDLSTRINEKLIEMTDKANERQGGISEQRLKGGVSSAQNASFANQIETFQRDVGQIKEAYEEKMISNYQADRNSANFTQLQDTVPAVRNYSTHLEHLTEMQIMCNRIFEENPNLQYSELEKQKQWTRIDGQMKMFYPDSSSTVSLPAKPHEEETLPREHVVSIPSQPEEPVRPLISEEATRENQRMLSMIFSRTTLKWIIGICTVAILVLVGVGIYFFITTWKAKSAGK